MTKIERIPMTPTVKQAAEWLVFGNDRRRDRGAVPQVQARFSLDLHEATAACAEAHKIRARAL